MGVSDSSHPSLAYHKVIGSQSCDTLVKMGHIQKGERIKFLAYISYPMLNFLWLSQVCMGYVATVPSTHVPDTDVNQHTELQLLPQEYKVLKLVVNR